MTAPFCGNSSGLRLKSMLHFPGFGWQTFRRLNSTAIQGPDGCQCVLSDGTGWTDGQTKPETTMKYTLTDTSPQKGAVLVIQGKWLPEELCGNRLMTGACVEPRAARNY
jgi:hypothetical protein